MHIVLVLVEDNTGFDPLRVSSDAIELMVTFERTFFDNTVGGKVELTVYPHLVVEGPDHTIHCSYNCWFWSTSHNIITLSMVALSLRPSRDR